MKSLVEFILEAKKPTVKDVPTSKLQVWFGRYMDQWCFGGYEDRNDGDCKGIVPMTDDTLQGIIGFIYVALNIDDMEKVCVGTLNDTIEKAVKKCYYGKEINAEYQDIVKVFTKRRLEIMASGNSMALSNKASVVTEIYHWVLSSFYAHDKERLSKLWPKKIIKKN